VIRAEYDREADAIYVWLPGAGDAFESVDIDSHRSVDVDEAGHVTGFEVLGLANYAVDDIAKRFGFEDLVPDINHAVTVAITRRLEVGKLVPVGGPAGDTPLQTVSEEPITEVVLTT